MPATVATNRWVSARWIAAALWLLVVGALTLSPQDATHMDPHLPQVSLCLVCGQRGASDALLNVLLFLPLGVFFVSRGRGAVWSAVAGLALSFSIEVAQHFIPGRYSNLGDVVWNTAGAGVGAGLWSARSLWLPPHPRWGPRLANGAVLIAVLATAAFGWLMEPDWPTAPYWGQWTPDLGFMDQYGGSVVEAGLDSIPIPSWRVPRRYDPRAALEGDWTMHATAVKGPPPRSLAPILNLYDAGHQEVTMLGAVGEDLVYRERSRARALRLDQPDLRLPDVLTAAAVGDTMRLAVRRHGGRRCVSFDEREACPAFTPGRAWSLLLYVEGPGEWMRQSVDAIWMFLLLVPVGLWSPGVRGLVARGLLTALGIAVAVGLTRLGLPSWSEVAAAVAGAVVGFAASGAARRRRSRSEGHCAARLPEPSSPSSPTGPW